jgi:hypothetical protein
MLELLEQYKGHMNIKLHDITHAENTAKAENIFFPTLTVLDKQYRYFHPLTRPFLEQVKAGLVPAEKPYLPHLGVDIYQGDIVPITWYNCILAGSCTGRVNNPCTQDKSIFLAQEGLDIYGFMNIESNRLLGGAEYMPSKQVPYPIPKDEHTAFITCVYVSDSEFDYKTPALKALEAYLKKKYTKVLGISDEQGVFPNGNLDFFLRNGYADEGVISEEKDYCRLHLVSKRLL